MPPVSHRRRDRIHERSFAGRKNDEGQCRRNARPHRSAYDMPGGAQAGATVYTMVEMAKAHGLNVDKPLAFLLERRPHAGMTDDELEKPLPWSDEARGSCDYAQQITCV